MKKAVDFALKSEKPFVIVYFGGELKGNFLLFDNKNKEIELIKTPSTDFNKKLFDFLYSSFSKKGYSLFPAITFPEPMTNYLLLTAYHIKRRDKKPGVAKGDLPEKEDVSEKFFKASIINIYNEISGDNTKVSPRSPNLDNILKKIIGK